MEKKLNELSQLQSENTTVCKPLFYRLSNNIDKENLNQLLQTTSDINVYDALLGQVEELVKMQNAKIKFSKVQLTEAALKHIGITPHQEYGVWVYYPWSKRLVHILDEKEFVEVRTSRNQYKITPEEEEFLATKKIGVIGLSVGQSIAITMAMERIFGELRLADFDILELSNYNRIRTGLHNLNVPKVIAVAREIAEIDPFLKVTCFPQGIDENNIDDFFLKGGKLDIVVDECDGLYIKILCRQKAKALKIPVVMDTSDRGMMDIERFDLEENRPVLHGLIEHLDIGKLKEAKTNEEKIPYILPMVGIDQISTRLKASMMEVEESITTWPQLASSVMMGGGMGTDVCRRILLNQFHASGRFYIDLEELIGNNTKNETTDYSSFEDYHKHPFLTLDYMKSAKQKFVPLHSSKYKKPSVDVIKSLVESATLAPSGGNCQPWKWLYENGELILFFEKAYSKSFLDYNDVAAYVALGAAFENLVLKARALNMDVEATILPVKDDEKIVARINFVDYKSNDELATIQYNQLVDGIELRCTNRNISERKIIERSRIDKLEKIVNNSFEGARLQIIDDDSSLKKVAEIIGIGDRLRFLHPQGHYDLYYNEVRWNKEENDRKRDGVDLETIPFTPSEFAGFKLAMDEKAINYLRKWRGGRAFEKASKKAVENASGVGLITLPKSDKEAYFNGGRLMQRVWLAANIDHISIHPIHVPLMLFARAINGNGVDLPKEMHEELIELRKKYLQLFDVPENTGEIFLFRYCIADEPKVKSLRRRVEDVLHIV